MKPTYLTLRITQVILATVIFIYNDFSYADNFLIVSEAEHIYHRGIVNDIKSKLLLNKDNVTSVSASETTAGSYQQYDTVITIGYQAAKQLLTNSTRTPVLSLLIPQQAFELTLQSSVEKDQQHLFSSIYIDQPVDRQLRLIRHLSKNFNTVGVLFGKKSYTRKDNITHLIQNTGLIAKSITVLDRTALITETRHISEEADILLAIPDNSIYNRRSIKGILLTTYRKKIPVLGYSKAYVRAGALAATYSSADNICQQAIEILNRHSKSKYNSVTRASPKYFSIEINEKVAHSLNINITDKKSLVDRLVKDENRNE